MAEPITKINRVRKTEEEVKSQSLESLLTQVAANEDSLHETLLLIQELHESGILEALNSMLKTKEEIAKIAVNQVMREPITNLINNGMAAGSALTALDPEVIQKLADGLKEGLSQAEDELKNDSKVKMFDLIKAINDPDINRAINFALNIMKGLGSSLKEE